MPKSHLRSATIADVRNSEVGRESASGIGRFRRLFFPSDIEPDHRIEYNVYMSGDKFLYTVRWPGEHPSIDQLCEKYGLRPEELDAEFGIIEIDPEEGLYSILIDSEAYSRISQETLPEDMEGPFSNPPIAPFGPPES